VHQIAYGGGHRHRVVDDAFAGMRRTATAVAQRGVFAHSYEFEESPAEDRLSPANTSAISTGVLRKTNGAAAYAFPCSSAFCAKESKIEHAAESAASPTHTYGVLAKVVFCMYGTPWRKPTTLAVLNLPGVVQHLHVCHSRVFRQRTGKQHIILQGSAHGCLLTKRATPYPLQFARTPPTEIKRASRFNVLIGSQVTLCCGYGQFRLLDLACF
jgi:hypothetical protein